MFNQVGISTAETTNSESSCVERAYRYYTDDGWITDIKTNDVGTDVSRYK
jgi:hypothetical protein